MSRIFEALQRAHRERETTQASDETPVAFDNQVVLPEMIPGTEEPIEVQAEDVQEWETQPVLGDDETVEPATYSGIASYPGTTSSSGTASSSNIADSSGIAAPASFPGIVEPPPAKIDFVPDNIVQHAWKPSIVSLPTLAERGGGVEQFRRLRSRIYQAHYEAGMKTILIASGMPAEGKSFVAANLAVSLARNTVNRILLIDGDMRRPTLHSLLGAPDSPGLSDYLEGTADLADILQRDSRPATEAGDGTSGISNLAFIPAGKPRENSSELVANHRIEDLIAAVSPHFNWILIDSPPVLAVTDAVELARAADALLLVARGAETPYNAAQRTQAAFANSRILGFVLNAVKDVPRNGSYDYDYYYGGTKRSRAKKDKEKEK